jgi:uncharacterized tellurite resistance protein B-like protein
MINRIREFFVDRGAKSEAADGHHSVDEIHLAAAALLVEAASIDTDFDAAERARIIAFAENRLGLEADEARMLVTAAETAVGEATQLYRFTSAVKDNFSYDERVGLIETLWEVVYADGEADAFESQLMRRIGGLIYVTDRDRGEARKRVLARFGPGGGAAEN